MAPATAVSGGAQGCATCRHGPPMMFGSPPSRSADWSEPTSPCRMAACFSPWGPVGPILDQWKLAHNLNRVSIYGAWVDLDVPTEANLIDTIPERGHNGAAAVLLATFLVGAGCALDHGSDAMDWTLSDGTPIVE